MDTPELNFSDYENLIEITQSAGSPAEVEDFLGQFFTNPMFSRFQVFTNQAVRILETASLKYLYVSESMLEMTGFTPKEIQDGGLMFIYKRVHTLDVLRLTVATYKIKRALKKLSPEEKLRARFSYDVRFRCKDGAEKQILQNCHILKLNKSLDPLILLFASTDITAYKKDDRMNYSLGVYEDGKGFRNILKDSIADECPLSVRELEVLSMTSHGFSEKEIADNLNLSSATVKTHRRNMIQKMNVKNSVELVRVAIAKNWI